MADESHKLKAEVLTPDGKIFEGELFQLSARTVVGEVGVRARHAPMLARLVPSTLRLFEEESDLNSNDGGERWITAEGWLEVFANRVTVLVSEAHETGSLDTSDLKSKLDDAEQRLSEAEEDSAAHRAAEQDKARYEAFIEISEG